MPTKKVAAPKITPSKLKVKAKVSTKTKSSGEKSLVYAIGEVAFWTTDGQVLSSLVSLSDALKDMTKSVFSHHVARGKNDFAAWVEVVLEDKECAKELRAVKTPAAAHVIIQKYLKGYRI